MEHIDFIKDHIMRVKIDRPFSLASQYFIKWIQIKDIFYQHIQKEENKTKYLKVRIFLFYRSLHLSKKVSVFSRLYQIYRNNFNISYNCL